MNQNQNENSNQLFQGEYITGFKVKEVCNPTNQGNDKSSIKSNKIIELNPTSVYDENKILIEIKKEDSFVEDSNEKILQSELEKKKDGKNRLSLEANDKKSIKKGMNIIKKKDKSQKKKAKIPETKKNDLTKENKPQQEKEDSSNDKNDGYIFPNLNNNNQRNNNTIVIDLTDDEDISEDFKIKTLSTSIISIVNFINEIAFTKYGKELKYFYNELEYIITRDNYKQILEESIYNLYIYQFYVDKKNRTSDKDKNSSINKKKPQKNSTSKYLENKNDNLVNIIASILEKHKEKDTNPKTKQNNNNINYNKEKEKKKNLQKKRISPPNELPWEKHKKEKNQIDAQYNIPIIKKINLQKLWDWQNA